MSDKLLAEWFWIDRWDGSRAVLLPMEAQGIYRAMLSQAWRRGARLPADLDEVQLIIRCRPSEWARSWPLVAPFWIERDGHLVNETQLEVYNETVRLREGKVKGGKARSEQARRTGSGRFEPAGSPAGRPADSQQVTPADVQPPSPSPSPYLSPYLSPDTLQGRGGVHSAEAAPEPPNGPPMISSQGSSRPPAAPGLTPEDLGIRYRHDIPQQKALAEALTRVTAAHLEKEPSGNPSEEARLILITAGLTAQGKTIDSLDITRVTPTWASVTTHKTYRWAQDHGLAVN